MNIRLARECDQNNIMEIWNYCFNDGPKFTEYYFNNKYSIDCYLCIKLNKTYKIKKKLF